MPYIKTNFTDGGGEPISAANLNKMEVGIESGANHSESTSNPHSVNKEQVGLGNVDNTSDLNKPISTSTQTALNAKQDTLVSGTNIKTVNGESVVGSGDIVVEGGSGGSAFWTPKIKSGRWSDFREGGQYVTGGALNTGSIILSPFNVYQEETITDFTTKLSSTIVLNFTFCIYSSDILNPLSITLEHSEEVTTTASAGAYSVTLSTPLVLDPTKLYWKGISVSDSNYRGDYMTGVGTKKLGWYIGSAGGDWAMTQIGMKIPHTYGNPIPTTATIVNTAETNIAPNFSMKVQ